MQNIFSDKTVRSDIIQDFREFNSHRITPQIKKGKN